MSDNLALQISSDPMLIKNYLIKLALPEYKIPDSYDDFFESIRGIAASDKGVLISKISNPEDYQLQLSLISLVQSQMDKVHEANTHLYGVLYRWSKLLREAKRHIDLTYFTELDDLRTEGIRKTVINAALHPIQEGVDRLSSLVERGEKAYAHLINTNWNIKEADTLIKEYLTLLKFTPGIKSV